VLASTFVINHFELFGLRQVLTGWRKQPTADAGFRRCCFTGSCAPVDARIHHRILGGADDDDRAPALRGGNDGYILIALQLEARDLMAELGVPYAEYRESVPILIPGLRPRGRSASRRATKSLT
jgi:methanethiol S-methyltransferase